MATREGKALTKFLEANGYQYARTNTKGFRVYKNPNLTGSHSVQAVTQSVSDKEVHAIISSICRELGIDPPGSGQKRNAAQIKARAAQDRRHREEEYNRKKAEYEALVREREDKLRHAAKVRADDDASFAGLGEYLTRRIQEREAEVLELLKLLSRRPLAS
jgi:ribosomal protein L12E/L44/L45/RPP1/RPP2